MDPTDREELTRLVREDLAELRPRADHAPRRVQMIEESTRSLRLGCWALVPFLGFVCGPVAFNCWVRSRVLSGLGTWNPARHHAACGATLGVFGFLVSTAWLVLLLK